VLFVPLGEKVYAKAVITFACYRPRHALTADADNPRARQTVSYAVADYPRMAELNLADADYPRCKFMISAHLCDERKSNAMISILCIGLKEFFCC